MAIEEALVTRLTGASAISAIAGDRVSWFWFQRGDTGGRIALTKVSPGESWTHDGPDGLPHPRVQIDCRADDADSALALSKAVIAEMHEAADVGTVRFHPAALQREQMIDEGELEGGTRSFRVSLDFLFYHETISA